MSAESMRLKYNRLAEKYGWKTIPKGRSPGPDKLARQLKDLEDCVEAGILVQVIPDEPKDNWDGVVRKAPVPKGG
jgi:hypothetical protein